MLPGFAPKVRRRVAVTGLGIVSPLGATVMDTWSGLLAGCSAVRPISEVPHYIPPFVEDPVRRRALLHLPSQVAAPVMASGFDPTSRETRAQRFATAAVREALTDSGIHDEKSKQKVNFDTHRFGVNVGCGMAGIPDIAECCNHLFGGESCNANRIGPFFIPKILGNVIGGTIAAAHDLRGPCHCSMTACATGAHAIGDAARWIQHGDADVAIAGATEACITPTAVAGFSRMRALATKFNDSPQRASRPFDAGRNGFVIGEGCGVMVLEELEHALARKAKIYAELRGFGMSGDAHHVSSPRPDGDGATNSIRNALSDGECPCSAVAYFNAHATSTPIGDEIELAAIARCLCEGSVRDGGNGKRQSPVLVSSSKGCIGHLLGAAGAVEAIVAVLALYHKIVPPNVNLESPLAHDTTKIVLPTVQTPMDSCAAAMSTSFGFGGTNAALLFTTVEGPSK